MSARPPRISVIIPCYNAARYVERTVASVKAQTLADWELILVDDGSTDQTGAILDSLASSDSRIRIVSQTNLGISTARNNGARKAGAASYLLFLDADDILEADMLDTMVEYLDDHSDVVLAYCGITQIDSEDRFIRLDDGDFFVNGVRFVRQGLGYAYLPPSEANTPLMSLMSFHTAIPSTCVFRADAFWRAGGWDKTFTVTEDKDMTIHMAMLGNVHFVSTRLLRYRRHESSWSTRKPGQLSRVTEKWWHNGGLHVSQRRMVRSAILFDHWLTMAFQLKGAIVSARQLQPRAACQLLLQAANSGRRFALRYAENLLWSCGKAEAGVRVG